MGRHRIAAVWGGQAVLVLSVIVLLSGCARLKLTAMRQAGATDWATEGGGAERQQAWPERIGPPRLVESWRYDADAGFGAGSPLGVQGVVFASTRKGEVYALDVVTGEKLGVQKLADSVEGTPALDGNVLYVPNGGDGRAVLAFELTTGTRKWERKGGAISAGLLVTGSVLVGAATDGSIWAVDKRTGEEVWLRAEKHGYFAAPVLVDANAVAVANDRGTVHVLRVEDGAERWATSVAAPVYATPATAEGLLFVPTTRGQVVALDTATGNERWRFSVPSPLVRFAASAVAAGLLVVGGSDGVLYGLDAATGTERWRFQAGGNFAAAPLIAGDLVLAGSMDRHLYVLDATSGVLIEKHEVKGRIKSALALHRGRVIVLSEPKYVYAFRPADAASE